MIQCVISSLCGGSRTSCKYWYVIKRAERWRTVIDVLYRTKETLPSPVEGDVSVLKMGRNVRLCPEPLLGKV